MQSDMNGPTLQLLASFSDACRTSTLKRLELVEEGAENWALTPEAMSFADMAHHLIQCDLALLRIFEKKQIGKNIGERGACVVSGAAEFQGLVTRLEKLKKERRLFLWDLMDQDLDVLIDAERIRGVERIPAGLLILEFFDHEAHHRGQMAAYLKAYQLAKVS